MNFIDFSEEMLGLESLKMPSFQIEKEFDVAFENFNNLFEGMKKLTPKQIEKPEVRDALMNRIATIGKISGVSTEGLAFDPEDLHYGIYSTESGFFASIKKWVLKIVNWIIAAFEEFMTKAKIFFNNKWRKAQAAVDNGKMKKAKQMNALNRRNGKSENTVTDTIEIGLPGSMMMVFHTQRHFPKDTISFTSKMLKESNESITLQFANLVTKMSSDTLRLQDACTTLLTSPADAFERTLDDVKHAIGGINGVRGLMESNFHCCGFEIHAVILNTNLFKTTTGCKLAPLQNLIAQWDTSRISFEIDLAQYETINTQIEANATIIDNQLQHIAGQLDSGNLKRELRRLRDDVKRMRDLSVHDSDAHKSHQYMLDRLTAIQQFMNMSFNNIGKAAFFHAKYSEALRKLMSLIAEAVDNKVTGKIK